MNSSAVCFSVVGLMVAGLAHAESRIEENTNGPGAIATEAFMYGYPMVDSYRIMHAYFVDEANPEFKAPWNTLRNISRVFTPEDKAVQTPNSDTPYSFLGLDLRAEPIVLTVPPIEDGRYFSIQLIDGYTHNFDYIGSRATGNGGGRFMVAGPGWKGDTPPGIDRVFRCETELAMALYRTQLLSPDDLDNVKAIQAQYEVQPLSAFLGLPAPEPAPPMAFVTPLTPAEQTSSLELFNLLNFVLTYCPTVESETDLMARFATIGVGAGRHIDVETLSPEAQADLQAGIAGGLHALEQFKQKVNSGEVTSGEIFGTRAYLNNNYLYRFAAAVLGIYGNSKEEAMYPAYRVDAAGKPLNAAESSYTIRFAPEQLPPVNAFWSITMYELPSSLLSDNALNRYLINSPMLPDLQRDADGGITLYVQHTSPGADKESNWLPAPNGPFWCAMRLYWPKDEALNGTWKPPAMIAAP
jgi:hypothetical protein